MWCLRPYTFFYQPGHASSEILFGQRNNKYCRHLYRRRTISRNIKVQTINPGQVNFTSVCFQNYRIFQKCIPKTGSYIRLN